MALNLLNFCIFLLMSTILLEWVVTLEEEMLLSVSSRLWILGSMKDLLILVLFSLRLCVLLTLFLSIMDIYIYPSSCWFLYYFLLLGLAFWVHCCTVATRLTFSRTSSTCHWSTCLYEYSHWSPLLGGQYQAISQWPIPECLSLFYIDWPPTRCAWSSTGLVSRTI